MNNSNKATREQFLNYVEVMADDYDDIKNDVVNGDRFTGFDPELDKIRARVWQAELEISEYCKNRVEK